MKQKHKLKLKTYLWLGFFGLLLVLFVYAFFLVSRFGLIGGAFISSNKTYLLVFQNEAELRPTGGFIGAYGLLHTGIIPSLEIKDSYTLENHSPEQAPEPVNTLLNDGVWYNGHFFRDSNLSPDFPTAAQEMIRMYNLNFDTPQQIDGVVAVNLNLLPQLLDAVGGAGVGDKYFTSANAFYELEVALRPTDAHDLTALNTRKDLLKDLAKSLILKAGMPWHWSSVSGTLSSALDTKEIQLYFTDSLLESATLSSGWGGAVSSPKDEDLLAVNFANYGGKKTDRYIERKIDYSVQVDENGNLIGTLTLWAQNRADETLLTGDWFGWLRVYLPTGTKLLDTDQELSEDLGYALISETLELPKGATWTKQYRYQLPFKFKDNYALNVVHQSGLEAELSVDVRNLSQNFWQSDTFQPRENHALYEGNLTQDLHLTATSLPDTTAPFATNQHLSDLNTLWVDLSEPLALGRAIVTGNYELKDLDEINPKTDTDLKIISAEHYDNVLKLTISGMTDQPEERYALTFKNQQDRSGNKLVNDTVTVVQRFK